jgi:3-deoxy-D-manno-octulosonate 8-phosphate phosphatase (KDO 8-P phosphatase)
MQFEEKTGEDFFQRLKKIRGFIFDVDGVLTDGQLLLVSDGEWLRSMNIRDGFAINHAIEMHYMVAVITGSNSEAIKKRLEALGVEDIFMDTQNKAGAVETFKLRHGLHTHEVLAVGDDIPEIGMLLQSGISCCPSDAAEEIKEAVDYVLSKPGGRGAVREIIEMVLSLHDRWPKDLSKLHDKSAAQPF